MKLVTIILLFICTMQSFAQEAKDPDTIAEKYKVRLSQIVVDSTRLEEYNVFLKEEIEASMQLEPGVLTLYATAEKKHPNRITILEIYASEITCIVTAAMCRLKRLSLSCKSSYKRVKSNTTACRK